MASETSDPAKPITADNTQQRAEVDAAGLIQPAIHTEQTQCDVDHEHYCQIGQNKQENPFHIFILSNIKKSFRAVRHCGLCAPGMLGVQRRISRVDFSRASPPVGKLATIRYSNGG